MIQELKSFLKEQKVNFLLLPNSNQFFSEYLPESDKIIQYLTGFSGSNAVVIFGLEKSYFFTDSRYILQANDQLDKNQFNIIDIAKTSVNDWIKANIAKNHKLMLDPSLVSVNFVKFCQKMAINLVFCKENPAIKLWQDRPELPNSTIFSCNLAAIGQDSLKKRLEIAKKMQSQALIITDPQNLCWLLNIRAADIEFSPTLLAYAILHKNGEIDLFIEQKRLKKGINLAKTNIIDPKKLDFHLKSLKNSIKTVQIDEKSSNYWLYNLLLEHKFDIINKNDPIELAKSCKNSAEIAGAIKSHEIDGLALTKFLFWFENSLKNSQKIDEISAAQKLLELRQENSAFYYPSFASISAFESNGAIIHYQPTAKTNKEIKGNSLYLIDSGGQYLNDNFCGTTDVTRTIAVGEVTKNMIANFTRVLKGHIALARIKFSKGASGSQLDILARQHLFNAGLNYGHGTGHGVGSFASVHEGPCAISKNSHLSLKEGMILSNEPGFYQDFEYGIRIENLLLVEKFNDEFLQFRNLTLAPIDPRLIDFRMLTYPEKKWLKNYHQKICDRFLDKLDIEQQNWLKKLSQHYFAL